VPKNAVDVIFDSSLTDSMATIATAFHKATGLTMLQTSGETGVDAKAIAGKTTVQDVFVSQGATTQKYLEEKAHGSWVSWYAEIGSTPLVLAYGPKSKFAKDLQSMPWYKVVTMKGFSLGRATPDTDSSAGLAATALNDTAKSEHLSALTKLASSKANIDPETELVAKLQQGHLSAAFLYGVDADTAGLETVSLGPLHLMESYMISILRNSAHEGAAVSFVKYLLRPSSASLLAKAAVNEKTPPILIGKLASVPPPLRSVFT
jgi:molybdate/tungstate transport system substrate-binding protein